VLARQTTQAMAWNAALAPVVAVIALVGTLVVARRLSLDQYGIYAIAGALVFTLLAYGDLGMSAGVSRFLPEMVERRGRRGAVALLSSVLALRVVIFAALILSLLLLPRAWMRLFRLPADGPSILIYVGLIVLTDALATTFLYVLTARFRLKTVNLMQAGYGVTQAALLIVASGAGWGVPGVLGAMVAGSALRLVAGGTLALREIAGIPEHADPEESPWFARFLKVSASSYFEKLVTSLHSPQFLTLLLAATVSKAEVAVFALAGDFVLRAVSAVMSPANGVILPAFAVAFMRGREAKEKVFSYTVRLLTLLSLTALVILLATTTDLVALLYTSRYAAAAPLVRIWLLFYFLEFTIYAPANAALLTGENLRLYFGIKAFSLALVPLYLMAGPRVSLIELAVLMGVLRLLTAVALFGGALLSHRLRYPPQGLRTVAAAALTGTLLWAVEVLWPLPPVASVLVGAGLGLAGMTVLLRLLGTFDDEDRRLVRATGLPGAHVLARIM